MAILIQQSEVTAALRRMYFHCVDLTDGMTPETGEVGGQPQISLNGAAWGNTTNVLVAIGNGRYYVELVAATEVNAIGVIEGRYKSGNTAESIGTTLQVVTDLVDAICDEIMEGTITLRQTMRLVLAVLTAKSSGGGTDTITFRDIGDTKDRLVVTVDEDGNRTIIIRDVG